MFVTDCSSSKTRDTVLQTWVDHLQEKYDNLLLNKIKRNIRLKRISK